MPLAIRARHLEIPMRTRFKHASAERRVADSVWVEASRDGHTGLGEGCPRSYVTGESAPEALRWIEARRARLEREVDSPDALRAFAAEHAGEIDAHLSAWCALELALLDLLAREREVAVEALLGLPPLSGAFQYTAVVSDEPQEKLRGILTLYLAVGFRDFKFKVSGDLDEDRARFALLAELARERQAGALRIRVDANNLWKGKPDEAVAALSKLGAEIFAVEEPVEPGAADDLARVSTALGVPMILDESLCRASDLARFRGAAGRFIGNVRVSKCGGLLRSLEVVEALRAAGCRVIVGAQVGETSVLTRAALTVARAAGDLLEAQEGAYGTILLERDMVEPVLQFGEGGVLRYPPAGHEAQSALGLGLVRSAE
jgi:L-alanine-DL-glutamate epimerase-like enolase superfamily enzyme